MRARSASPAPASSPQHCGVQQLAAQVLPTTVNCGRCFHLIPRGSLDLPVLLGCPCQGKIFSCGHGQAAWGLVLAGILCSESSICYPHPLFFHLEENPGRGESRGSGGRDSPRSAELLGTPSPGSRRGQPVLPAPPSPFRAHLGTGDPWDLWELWDLWDLWDLCPRDAPAPLALSSSC